MSFQRFTLFPVLLTFSAILVCAERPPAVNHVSEHSQTTSLVSTQGFDDPNGHHTTSMSAQRSTTVIPIKSLVISNKSRNRADKNAPKKAINPVAHNPTGALVTNNETAVQNQDSNSRIAVHKRSVTDEQTENSSEDYEAKRAFKFGKRVRLDQSEANDELAEKRAFKFGKKSSDLNSDNFIVESDNNNPSLYDEEKRAFKFGKKSAPHSMEVEDNSEFSKRGFKFGKKSSSGVEHLTETTDDLLNDDKRAFKFGKRAEKNDDKFFEEKKAFKFGKRYDEDDEKRAFKFGKRYDEDDEKRAFKFGKRYDEDDEKRAFKFGKRYEEDDEKRAFKFGKRYDEDDEKRAFKFGKRFSQYEDAIDSEKKAFKFGKRDVDKKSYPYEENVHKLPLSYSNQFEPALTLSERNIDKKPIKFGKKSTSGRTTAREVQHTTDDIEYAKKAFKFGKKSVSNSQQYDVINEDNLMDNKRAFKFGKKSEQRRPSKIVPREDTRMFKFGKKSSNGYEPPNTSYSRYPTTLDHHLMLQDISVPAHGVYVTKRYLKLKPGLFPGYFPEKIRWLD